MMTFTHPLARDAKVCVAHGRDGKEQSLLVVVTTVELDPDSPRYKAHLVRRLSIAATEYVARSAKATGFVLMNRPCDWVPRSTPAKIWARPHSLPKGSGTRSDEELKFEEPTGCVSKSLRERESTR
jgi:hypothetical protein